MTNPRKTGYCAVCEYIKKHKKCGLNTKLMEGASYRSIALETGLDQRTIAKHWKAQHGMKKVLEKAGCTRAVKDALELAKCQKIMWDKAQKAIGMALGDEPTPKNANLSVFGQCAGPAIKIIEVLAKVAPNDSSETESDGFEEALKAKAKDVWKEARPVQVATTEPEAMADDDLVET